MIHIAAVHHKFADWIPLQRMYLELHIQEPFTFYGTISRLDDEWETYFDVTAPTTGPEPHRLNHLGQLMVAAAAPDDIIVFLGPDAIPVVDPVPMIRAALDDHALVAISHPEEPTERHPHRSFCATTAAAWVDLPGDWAAGWFLAPGTTAPGANLLYQLEATGTPWLALERTNRVDVLGPRRINLYGDVVYQHGGRIDTGSTDGPADPFLESIRSDPSFYKKLQ